jgi:hypothetical protein
MAQSPKWKVYDACGTYQAACKEIEAAAALIGFYGDGATIRLDHAKSKTVWTEGSEDQYAHESYDFVAEIVEQRRFEIHAAALRKAGLDHLIGGAT